MGRFEAARIGNEHGVKPDSLACLTHGENAWAGISNSRHQHAKTARDSPGIPPMPGSRSTMSMPSLLDEISRDQRSYKFAIDGAEGAEHDSLTTIVELERRWSTYDFDWAESDPKSSRTGSLTFEKERERRK